MRIHIAGLYSHIDTVKKVRPPYVLETFYSLKGSPKTKKAQVQKMKMLAYLQSFPKDDFLLDSGAFSFMRGLKDSKVFDFDNYVKQYVNFINKFDVKLFFEMDVDLVVGLKKVEEYRAFIEKETGKQCIPVWHKARGVDYWIRMIEEYSYVAIGASGLTEDSKWVVKGGHILKKFCELAAKKSCKVHGLGYTKTRELQHHKFYSVDSTTWLSPSIYGIFHIFNPITKKITAYQNPKARITLSSPERTEQSLIEWKKYVLYMDSLGRKF